MVAALLVGLGLGNHLTLAALLPCVAAALVLEGRRGNAGWRGTVRYLAAGAGAAVLGLGVYAYLPVAASAHPPVNWGAPDTPGGFLWTVTASAYRPYAFAVPAAGVWERLLAWLRMVFLDQFTPVGAVLALTGALELWRRGRALLLLTAVPGVLVLAYALPYGTGDSYLYLIPLFMVAAVWIAVGLEWAGRGVRDSLPDRRWAYAGRAVAALRALLDGARSLARLSLVQARALSSARRREAQGPVGGREPATGTGELAWRVLVAALLVGLAVKAGIAYPGISLRGDDRATTYAEEALLVAPRGSLLLAGGDREVFPLWYYLYALGMREDVAVVSPLLLQYDWYARQVGRAEPDLLPRGVVEGGRTAEERLGAILERAVPARPTFATSSVALPDEYERRRMGPLYRVSR